MKKLLIILLCVPFIGFGQSIINGSFENNTSGVCRTNLSNLDFNNYMHDCLAFGTANEIDIQNDNKVFPNNKQLIKIVDLLGRESKDLKSQPLFYIYDDGTVEKKIIIE